MVFLDGIHENMTDEWKRSVRYVYSGKTVNKTLEFLKIFVMLEELILGGIKINVTGTAQGDTVSEHSYAVICLV